MDRVAPEDVEIFFHTWIRYFKSTKVVLSKPQKILCYKVVVNKMALSLLLMIVNAKKKFNSYYPIKICKAPKNSMIVKSENNLSKYFFIHSRELKQQ